MKLTLKISALNTWYREMCLWLPPAPEKLNRAVTGFRGSVYFTQIKYIVSFILFFLIFICNTVCNPEL